MPVVHRLTSFQNNLAHDGKQRAHIPGPLARRIRSLILGVKLQRWFLSHFRVEQILKPALRWRAQTDEINILYYDYKYLQTHLVGCPRAVCGIGLPE